MTKGTYDEIMAFVSDCKKIDKKISELYENKQIYSYLRTNLLATVDYFAKNINSKYFGNNIDVGKELDEMEATRPLFAQEYEARGKAIGEANAARAIGMYVRKKSPKEISDELGISINKVNEIIRASGLMG
jgi:hypothetical protein